MIDNIEIKMENLRIQEWSLKNSSNDSSYMYLRFIHKTAIILGLPKIVALNLTIYNSKILTCFYILLMTWWLFILHRTDMHFYV